MIQFNPDDPRDLRENITPITPEQFMASDQPKMISGETYAQALRALPPRHEVVITGPALHETQIRAYALAAASHLPHANLRPSHADIDAWHRQVLDLAVRFEAYIRGGEA